MIGDTKENAKNKGITGLLIMALGILIFLAGAWLFTRTCGTALLYTNSGIGKISQYYWIVICIAVIVTLVGFLFVKKYPMKKEEQPLQVTDIEVAQTREEKESPVSEKTEIDTTGIKRCPACGKELKSETLFCIYCGEKL
ncbi:MAG: zinc ribbon domain-containing protein [Lachnospiraceae bacterium]|nr:zinc ribbon domain-containing protein [Lachnospiraceae bacterium]